MCLGCVGLVLGRVASRPGGEGEVASSKGLWDRFLGYLSGFCGKSVLWPGEVSTFFACGAVFLATWGAGVSRSPRDARRRLPVRAFWAVGCN